jgi:uncharacterized glyoxalase superfamily protein PhnB
MKNRMVARASGKHPAATPHLVVKDAVDAIAFYERAFGAERVECVSCFGRIGQAELRIAGARVSLSDEYPETGLLSPQSVGGSPACVVLRVPNAHLLVGRAVATGAKLRTSISGARAGRLVDPFGHIWDIASPRRRGAGRPSRQKGSLRPAR